MLNLGYISSLRTYKQFIFHKQLHILLRTCTSLTNTTSIRQVSHKDQPRPTEPVTFQDSIKYGREQAKRSILVQVQSTESCKELYSYCSTMGNIQQMLHYTTATNQLNFVIVEFSDEQHVSDIIQNGSHINTNESFPIHSNFLWFKASNRKNSKLKTANNFKLAMENGNLIPSMKEVSDLLLGLDNVNRQIEVLHDFTKLNEVATRLRFLTTRQVELSVAGMFPHAVAYPFGSSVNGFGKMGCDLDIVFKLADAQIKNDSRLVFHCKANNSYERSITHRHMEVISDMLQLFLPGCTQIRKILQARVPIIKYYQQFTDVECDLSMSNMSGVCMSDLLYLFGSIDARVRPLVFAIRKWAQEVGITNNSPGRWISNFSLTLLVLAFLQRPDNSPPILPSVHHVLQQIGIKCESVLEETLQFSFSKSSKVLKFETRNTDDLETLLKQFFNFYSLFDFSSNAISLNEAISITKPEHSPLYIVNPLERGLNVSKNVSADELDRFRYEVRNASWTLESNEGKSTSNWGLLEMFQTKKKSFQPNYHIPSKQDRLMDVSKLFEDSNDQEKSKEQCKDIQSDSFQYEKANR